MELYPAEIDIYKRQIVKRDEARQDGDFLRMLIAARAPHTKDHGDKLLKDILAKYKTLDEQDDVTPESRKRELAIARSLLRR